MKKDKIPLYDVVIPFHPKDTYTLERCISSIRTYAKRAGTIFVVSEGGILPAEVTVSPNVVCIDDAIFPFNIYDVQARIRSRKNSQGWYFQQLVKLYCFSVIPFLRKRALVINSDFELIAPIDFVSPDGKYIYMDWCNKHSPVLFGHAKTVLGADFKRAYYGRSGITDCAVFDREIVDSLLSAIEKNNRGRSAWMVLLEAVNPQDKDGMGMSEYDLVFNWASIHFQERILLRRLIAENYIKIDYSHRYSDNENEPGYFRKKYDFFKLLSATITLARNRPKRDIVQYLGMKFEV